MWFETFLITLFLKRIQGARANQNQGPWISGQQGLINWILNVSDKWCNFRSKRCFWSFNLTSLGSLHSIQKFKGVQNLSILQILRFLWFYTLQLVNLTNYGQFWVHMCIPLRDINMQKFVLRMDNFFSVTFYGIPFLYMFCRLVGKESSSEISGSVRSRNEF